MKPALFQVLCEIKEKTGESAKMTDAAMLLFTNLLQALFFVASRL
jgi:hypothetical protein